MYIALAVCILILNVLIHEIGHAVAMRNRGVGIRDLCIGLPFPGLPSWTIVSKERFGFPIVLHPLLIGGCVREPRRGEIQTRNLPRNQQIVIYAAGIWANLLFAAICLVVLGVKQQDSGFQTVGAIVTSFLLLIGRKDLSLRYVMPLVVLSALGITAYPLVMEKVAHESTNAHPHVGYVSTMESKASADGPPLDFQDWEMHVEPPMYVLESLHGSRIVTRRLAEAEPIVVLPKFEVDYLPCSSWIHSISQSLLIQDLSGWCVSSQIGSQALKT